MTRQLLLVDEDQSLLTLLSIRLEAGDFFFRRQDRVSHSP